MQDPTGDTKECEEYSTLCLSVTALDGGVTLQNCGTADDCEGFTEHGNVSSFFYLQLVR